MHKEPIDYNSPLGISKNEWARVLGVNLALLLVTYAVAIIFTLCGNDWFMLNVHNEYLQNIEDLLRSWRIYPLLQIGFATVEQMIILSFIMMRRPKWWWPVSYYALRVVNNLIFTNTLGHVPTASYMVINFGFCIVFALTYKKKCLKPFIRFAIALAVSLALNEGIAFLRTKVVELNHLYTNINLFYLTIEYHLALSLALGLLAIAIPWNKEKGEQQWVTMAPAGGSSPTSTNLSRKNLPTKKNNGLSEKQIKKIRRLKTRLFIIQLVALVFICAIPVLIGKPTEFALMYVAFCLTRLVLGFNRSLHFKSEIVCVSAGAFTFWFVTILTPSIEASIIVSLVYGASLALGFRLYWELHDLMMYKKAAKTDRYAMLYVVFKGNCDPKHINGVMRMKGYSDPEDIKMVKMYMQKDKVEYIADVLGYAKITVEKRLTEIATDLYQRR